MRSAVPLRKALLQMRGGYQLANRFECALPPSALTLCREGGRLCSAVPLRKAILEMRGGYQPANRFKLALPPNALHPRQGGGALALICVSSPFFYVHLGLAKRGKSACTPPKVRPFITPCVPADGWDKGPTTVNNPEDGNKTKSKSTASGSTATSFDMCARTIMYHMLGQE